MESAVDQRRCSDCDRLLHSSEFSYRNRARGVLHSRCKSCQSQRSRAHYRLNAPAYVARVATNNARIRAENRERLHEYLSLEECTDCGLQDLTVLEFDHRDPAQKRRDISTLVRKAFSWSAIVLEINKCDTVCANCHRKRTARQFGWYKVERLAGLQLPELPRRGSIDYERIKSRRSELARRHRNRELVWQFLVAHPCVLCGVDDPVVLDFDHISDKYRDIGWLIQASCRAAILVEMAKCRVLCANCHRRHTASHAGRPR